MAAAGAEALHDLTVNSVVRGFHVYKDTWVPVIGVILFCEQEPENEEDCFAIAVDARIQGLYFACATTWNDCSSYIAFFSTQTPVDQSSGL